MEEKNSTNVMCVVDKESLTDNAIVTEELLTVKDNVVVI